jgi:cell division septation protein DedD
MRNINRQRGFGTLILLAIAAVAIVGAIGTFAYQMRSAGKAAGIAQEQPKTEAATQRALGAELRVAELNENLNQALELNKRNVDQIEKMRGTIQEVQDEWDALKRKQAEQDALTRKALAEFTERAKRQAAEVRRLRELAATPSAVTITEGKLDEADAILRGTVRDILGLR